VMSQLASCHGSNRCTCVWWHTCEASHFVMQDLSESVVVEPYQASSECVEFSVTVLGSSKGPVVLLPTEVESYDMEDDLFEAALDFEVYKARREVALLFPLLLVPLHLLLVLPMWQLFSPPLIILSCCCFMSCVFCSFLLLLLFFLFVFFLFLPDAGFVSSHCLVPFVSRSGVLFDLNLHDGIVGALRTKKCTCV